VAVEKPKVEAPPPPPPEPVVETRLPLVLLGTMAVQPVHLSSAVIMNTQAKKPSVVGIGESIEGLDFVTVTSIEPRRVMLENNGKSEVLAIEEDENETPSVADLSSLTRDAGPRASRASRRPPRTRDSRASRPRLPRAASPPPTEEEDLARKTQQILSAARLLPAYDDETGQMNGVSITALEPGSVLEKMGFRNDDVIREVNGIAVDNPAATTRVFAELRSGKDMSIQITRGGNPEDLDVSSGDIAEWLAEE